MATDHSFGQGGASGSTTSGGRRPPASRTPETDAGSLGCSRVPPSRGRPGPARGRSRGARNLRFFEFRTFRSETACPRPPAGSPARPSTRGSAIDGGIEERSKSGFRDPRASLCHGCLFRFRLTEGSKVLTSVEAFLTAVGERLTIVVEPLTDASKVLTSVGRILMDGGELPERRRNSGRPHGNSPRRRQGVVPSCREGMALGKGPNPGNEGMDGRCGLCPAASVPTNERSSEWPLGRSLPPYRSSSR